MDKNKNLDQKIGGKEQQGQGQQAPSRETHNDPTDKRNVGSRDREDQERQQPGSKQGEPNR